MRFVHVGDTHLGKFEIKSPEREQDFYNAFKQVIDFAINKKVDFVIHSGDLFDKARPSVKTLIFTINQLKRLKKAGIPFFAIIGSHDMGVSDSIVSVLDEAGLLVNLNSSRYFKKNEKIELSGEKVGDCFICGLPGKRRDAIKMFESIIVKPKAKFDIFIFHHTISDISEKFADIPASALPRGFDYYAAGHFHSNCQFKYDKGIIVYPGSTEYNDLKEIESDPEKYFIYVETDPFKIERIKIKTRKFEILRINCEGLDAKEIAKKVNSNIKESNENAILIVKLFGNIKGTKSEINREAILENAKQKGYLTANIYLSDLQTKEEFFETHKKSIHEIEEEYLKRQKYNEKEIELAKILMSMLGQNLDNKELAARVNEVKEIAKEMFLDNKKN